MRIDQKSGRQPRLVVAGLALVVGCAAAGAFLARRSTPSTTYLELAEPVPAGAPIVPADLAAATMAPPAGLQAIPATAAREVIGRRAAVTLVRGTLLVAGELERNTPPGAGTALVGTSLQADQVPATLAPGDAVEVVVSQGTTASGGSQGFPGEGGTGPVASGAGSRHSGSHTLVVEALGSVFAIATAAATGQVAVTIAVPVAVAPSVALASAAGAVSLVEVPPAVTNHPRSR